MLFLWEVFGDCFLLKAAITVPLKKLDKIEICFLKGKLLWLSFLLVEKAGI